MNESAVFLGELVCILTSPFFWATYFLIMFLMKETDATKSVSRYVSIVAGIGIHLICGEMLARTAAL